MARNYPLKGKVSEQFIKRKIRNKKTHSKMKSFFVACAIAVAVQVSQAVQLKQTDEEELTKALLELSVMYEEKNNEASLAKVQLGYCQEEKQALQD